LPVFTPTSFMPAKYLEALNNNLVVEQVEIAAKKCYGCR
jgi:hypothetical protein